MGVIARPRAGHRLASPPSGRFTINRNSPQASGLVGWIPFSLSSGASTVRDMILGPSVSFGATNSWVFDGTLGAGVQLNETLNIIDVNVANGTPWTIAFWVKTPSTWGDVNWLTDIGATLAGYLNIVVQWRLRDGDFGYT